MPRSTISRKCRPNVTDSRASSPAAGSSRQRSLGRAASARATATSLRWPWLNSLGVTSARAPSANTSSASSIALERSAVRPKSSETTVRTRRMISGDGEILPHGQVVEELDGLPRPGQALPGAGVRGQPGDVGTGQLDGPPMGHEAGDGVDEGRLPGAVRADQTDELARLDVEVDVDHGMHATERHRDGAGREHAHDSLTTAARPPGASGPATCSRSASAWRAACASAAATSFARLPAIFLR